MITRKMREWLNSLPENPAKDTKYCVYMNRIQKRIDEELENLLWLCIKHSDIFIDEEKEINDLTGKIVSHRRLRKLLICVNNLNPNMNVELVLKKLKQEGYYPQPPSELLKKYDNSKQNI
jgi:hypothetical protein